MGGDIMLHFHDCKNLVASQQRVFTWAQEVKETWAGFSLLTLLLFSYVWCPVWHRTIYC